MGINSLQKNIFELDANNSSCAVFKIFPDEAAQPPHPYPNAPANLNTAISNLPRWISLSGGALLNSSDRDPFAIPIIDFHWYVDEKNCTIPIEDELPNDLFSSSFIYDAYIKGSFKDLDLNKYRVGKSSYVNYDANRILKREISWKQLLKARPIPTAAAWPIPAVVKIEPVAQEEIRSRSHTVTPAPAPFTATATETSSVSAPVLRSGGVSPVQNGIQSPIRNGNQKELETVAAGKTRQRHDAVAVDSAKKGSKENLPTTRSKTPGRPELPEKGGDSPDKNHSDHDRIIRSTPSISIPKTEPYSPRTSAVAKDDEREVSQFSSSPSPTSSDSGRKRVSVSNSSNQQNFLKTKRIEYTHDEGQKMLDYICRNDMHPYTKGNQIWVEMFLDKVTNHTDQSMKEHFRKKVYPRMYTAYECSREDRKKFELAERAVARGKRVPIFIARAR